MQRRNFIKTTVFSAIAICCTILLVCAGCGRTAPKQTPLTQCLAHFALRPDLPDTLHFFLAEAPEGAQLADSLLKTVLDSAQFESLHFGTGDARFLALTQFPFAEGLSAGLLKTEEFWFGKLSLLVFDHQQQKCLDVVELSHFYGGDGGQIASESWLIRNMASPKLVVKTAEHGFVVSDTTADEPQEYVREHVQLFQWEAKQFHPIPMPDSVVFLRQFKMHRTW